MRREGGPSRRAPERQESEEVVRTVCPSHCVAQYCGLRAHVKKGRLVKIEPADFPGMGSRICLRGLAQIQQIYHPERLKHPMIRVGERGEGKWRPISWDEAFDTLATKLNETMSKYGSTSVALMGGTGTLGRLAGTPNRLASLLHATTIVGGTDSAGPQAAQDTFGCGWWLTPDKEHFFGGSNEPAACVDSKLIIVWGANFAETAPFHMRHFFDAKEKGAKMVVIDPRFSPTASRADKWIGIRPGTDAGLALSMINVIVGEKLYDEAFLTDHTVGPFLVRSDSRLFLREHEIKGGGSKDYVVWDKTKGVCRASDAQSPALTGTHKCGGVECKTAFQKLIDLVEGYVPEKAELITGVPTPDIRELAIDYATRKPATFGLFYGLDRWHHANLSYRAIFALMAITGQIGVSGGGFFGGDPTHNPLDTDSWYHPEGRKPEKVNSLEIYERIPSGKPYPIKALWAYNTNFFKGCNRNRMISEVLPCLDFIVVSDRFITSAEYADIVLPACSSFETTDIHTGPFPYIQLQQKAIEPLWECKSDFEITAEVARRMGLGKYFTVIPEECIGLLIQNLEGASLERLRREGAIQIDVGGRPYIPFIEMKFPTPSGRVEFYVERGVKFGQELPIFIEPEEGTPKNPLAKKYPLVFLQSHSRFHTHTSHANNQWLLDVNPEPLLEINPVDAQARSVRDGDLVAVFNGRGEVKVKAELSEAMRPGTVDIHWGWWPRQFADGHPQCLTSEKINPALVSPNFSFFDCLVEVKKAGGIQE